MSKKKRRPLKAVDVKGKKNSIFTSYRLVPYPEIERILRNDGEAFVEAIDRRTAWSAAKILSRRLGFVVKAKKRVLLTGKTKREGEYEGMEGYIFLKVKTSF